MADVKPILVVASWLLLVPTVAPAQDRSVDQAPAAAAAADGTAEPHESKPPPTTPYGEKGLFHGGYWSREEQPGHWIVNARVYGNEKPSRAFMIALYRSAELTKAAGYGEFRIIGQALKTTFIVYGYGGSRTTANYLAILNVVAMGSPSSGEACVMKNPHACLDLTTDKAFDLAGPNIGMPTSRQAVSPPTAPAPAR